MEYTFLFVAILMVGSLPTVVTRCSLSTYYKRVRCYQDQTNVIPSFPQYNGTLNLLAFYGEWMVRNLDKNSFTGISLVNQLKLENIGLQHLSCDVFINVRQELTILNLDNNMLAHFPACSVNNLYYLRELTLSKNFITCIPEHSIPSSLQHLDVSYNQIYTLSSAISTDVYNKNQLKTFNIRGNKLHRINKNELQQFSSLENLDASENQIDYIQRRLFVTSGIHLLAIDLSQNHLTGDVWPCLEHLQQVRNLNLSHNQIDHVNDNVVSHMENLQIFDISYNMVSEVGPAFSHQQTLQTLLFHHNLITKVTKDIFAAGTSFMDSFDLDMSFNLLVSVDLTILDCLYCTLSIHHNKLHIMRLSSNQNSTFNLIDISFNVLEAIPPHLPLWTNFNGSYNPFSTPSVMDFLSHLPDHSIHNVILKNITFLCKQTSIPEIQIFSKVTLDLADNCVSSEFLCHLRSTRSSPYTVSINLDRNGIEALQQCSLNVSIMMLSLKGNHLSFLNESFILEEMPDLMYLDLAENGMDGLNVDTLTGLRKLLYLNVSLNNVQELPTIVYTLNRFTSRETRIFDVSSCNISSRNNFIYRYELQDFYYVDTTCIVDISNNSLKHAIPISFITSHSYMFFTLHLNLADNHIESIKDVLELDDSSRIYLYLVIDFSRNEVKHISDLLHCLNVRYTWVRRIIVNGTHNMLTEFPTCDSLGSIKCIYRIHLDFSHNFLQALPNNETCILYRVVMLNVSHNSFTEIPEPIANSSTLLYLVMAGNKISTVTPSAFVGLPRLKELDLSFNRLTVFPESINHLSKLEKLNLAGNFILTVPDARSSLWPSLSVFQFHGNPLVCSCSAVWLRNYTLATDLGRCSYPVEHVGNAVTCLATLSCDASQSVYSSKVNIQACRTGLVLTNENQNLKWQLPSGIVQATPQSQANIEVFNNCQLVANFSSIGEDTWKLSDDSDETGDLVCLTLSDKTWISNITECLVLDPTKAPSVIPKKQNSVQTESQTPHSVYIAVIVTLSILLVAVTGTGLVIYIVYKKRKTVAKQRGTVPTISGQENTVYENYTEGETSFSGSPVTRAEDKHYYDSLHTSNTYDN